MRCYCAPGWPGRCYWCMNPDPPLSLGDPKLLSELKTWDAARNPAELWGNDGPPYGAKSLYVSRNDTPQTAALWYGPERGWERL